ncbi:MAG TPA: PQQ-dependent sugar dehydrogenase [Sphingopyxis sp.]|nr:PQQ-dependent sugar dehydrogenase [Sphingopyxis sp.]
MANRYGCIALLLLAGCGGSGGDGGPVTVPTNAAPIFTSASSVSTVENAALSYQAAASDADGDALTYTIAGGADAALFSIGAAGALSFRQAPDFDNPADADADNVYLVQLSVSDGRTSASLPLSVTVTNSREGIAVRRVFSGFNEPTVLAGIPGDSRFLVGERDGSIYYFDPATNNRALFRRVGPYDPVSGAPRAMGQYGLMGLAVSPDYATDGTFYAGMDDATKHGSLWAYSHDLSGSGPLTPQNIIYIDWPSGFAAKWLGFGPDNKLYFLTGDHVIIGDGTAMAEDVELGKLFAITKNPNPGGGFSYLVNLAAKELRNPATATFYGSTLLFGDRGNRYFGEVNRFDIGDPMLNYGWDAREGTYGERPAGLDDTEPTLQIAFGTGPKQGRSITVGPVYLGVIASLQGLLLMADSETGKIWTAPADNLVNGETIEAEGFARREADFVPDAGSIDGIVAMAAMPSGRYYMLDRDGELFEIQPAP